MGKTSIPAKHHIFESILDEPSPHDVILTPEQLARVKSTHIGGAPIPKATAQDVSPKGLQLRITGGQISKTSTQEVVAPKGAPGHSGHLKILVENAPIAMAMFDSQMRYLLANRRWIEDFKLENQEIIGCCQYELFPSLHPGWRHVYERALQGQIVRSDRDAVTRDGQKIVYRWEVRPWRNADTSVGGLMITCERLAAPANISPSAASDKIVPPPASPDGLWKSALPVVALDADGRVLRASDGAAQLFLSSGLEEGTTFFWHVLGENTAHGPVQQAMLPVIQAAVRHPAKPLQLALPIQVRGIPAQWLLTAVNGQEWGKDLVALAISMPALPELAQTKAPAARIDPEAPRALEELARHKVALKEAGERETHARHREDRLRMVLDSLPTGLLVLDPRGRPIYHNIQLTKLLGRPFAEGQTVEGWLTLSCRDEKHTEEVISQWREGVWKRQTTRTVTLSSTDGLLKEIEMTPAALDGNGFVVVFRDATESGRDEEMLRSTEAKLQTLIHECPTPVVLSDRAGSVFDANPEAETLLGFSRAELRRMPMSGWLQEDSYAARTLALREMAMRGDRSAEVPVQLLTNEGKALSAKLKLATVPDALGAPHFTIHFLNPVAPVVQAPAEPPVTFHSTETAGRPPAALALQWKPVFGTNAHGRITEWTDAAAEIFEYSAPEVMGRAAHLLFSATDAAGFYSEMRNSFGNPPVTLSFFRKVNGKSQALFSVKPREEGALAFTLETLLPGEAPPVAEIAETPSPAPAPAPKPSAAELKRERLLIGETHHRVKNHLQIITSMLNLQLSTMHNDEARDALRSSQNRVRSIAALHQHLYQLAAGETANFAQFASGLVEHLRECYAPDDTNVRVEMQISDTPVAEEWLMPLALALNEMVSNALKHAFPNGLGGTIRVGLVWGDSRTELSVEDDGVGLPEDFENLQTAGLGLKIIRVFAGQLGGEIRVTSKAAGGSSFVLSFPNTPVAE